MRSTDSTGWSICKLLTTDLSLDTEMVLLMAEYLIFVSLNR